MKSVQYFSDDYLAHCRLLSGEQIARFLEDFRLMHQPHSKSRLISLKVPEAMLAAFKARCKLEGIAYQTKIKQLMAEWLK